MSEGFPCTPAIAPLVMMRSEEGTLTEEVPKILTAPLDPVPPSPLHLFGRLSRLYKMMSLGLLSALQTRGRRIRIAQNGGAGGCKGL